MAYNNVTKRNVTQETSETGMDRHAYHTFQILDHIEKTPLVTNRRVAGKLNVSVKLAHNLLTRLVKKGLLHIRKRNSRRWDYFLTPKGLAEKARLTYEFMDFTMQFYREARRRSAAVLAELRKQGVKRIAFLGVSELAEIAFLGLQEQKLDLTRIFDDVHAGEDFMGLEVEPTARLAASKAERVLVTAYDPALPMGERYLPAEVAGAIERNENGAAAGARLVWVFGGELASENRRERAGASNTGRLVASADADPGGSQ